MDLELTGRTAVVTASSAGLGRAVARTLLDAGCRVAISGRGAARLGAARVELAEGRDDHVLAQSLDLRDAGAVVAHLDDIEDRWAPIDILVWNSGGPPPGLAADVDIDQLDDAYQLLLRPAVAAAHRVLPGMRERGFGRIIGMTSIAVRQPHPQLALSNTLRAGLTGYLKTLSREVAADGVTVNTICTGGFATERMASLAAARAAQAGISSDAERRATEAEIPAGRFGRPEEFGDLVAFLASARASYVTGAAIPIDGGAYAGLL